MGYKRRFSVIASTSPDSQEVCQKNQILAVLRQHLLNKGVTNNFVSITTFSFLGIRRSNLERPVLRNIGFSETLAKEKTKDGWAEFV